MMPEQGAAENSLSPILTISAAQIANPREATQMFTPQRDEGYSCSTNCHYAVGFC